MPFWMPTLLVIVVTAMALAGTKSPPVNASGGWIWRAGILLFGCLAVGATVWQSWRNEDSSAIMAGTASSAASLLSQERSEPATADLRGQINALEERVRELEAGKQVRTVAPGTREELATFLRGSGTQRVIVSCIPGDLEAYQYANQLVSILKAAGWEAQGPEVTKIFGDVRSPSINFPDYALPSAIKLWYKTGTYVCFCGFERWRATRCNFKRGSARPSLLFFTEQRISAGRR